MPIYGGIDLGGTKIQTIVMRGEDRSVLGQARTLTPHEGGPPAVIDALDVRPPLTGFEVFLDAVPEPRTGRAKLPVQLSVFQPIERDFAFVVDRELPAENLLRAARGVDRKLVTEIRLFDIYQGVGLPESKKSLAITVVLQPQERTLTDADVPHVVNPRLVRGLDYYTRTTFEVISTAVGAQSAVAAGGPYS